MDTRVQLNKPKDKSNKMVNLESYEELIKHYNCKGCSQWFSIVDNVNEPNFCPHCGKRIKEITCTK